MDVMAECVVSVIIIILIIIIIIIIKSFDWAEHNKGGKVREEEEELTRLILMKMILTDNDFEHIILNV